MASLSLDRMRPEDLDEVLAIERASFSMPWSRGAFLYEMQQNRVARCLVARDEGMRVAGYLCLWEVSDEIHIANVAVRPDSRRQGIARSLLRTVLDDARARRFKLVVLEVRPSNRHAVTLYESFGFRVPLKLLFKERPGHGKPRHHRLPGQPEFRPAMQQEQRLTRPRAGDMERRAIGLNRQMLHFLPPFLCPGAQRIY